MVTAGFVLLILVTGLALALDGTLLVLWWRDRDAQGRRGARAKQPNSR